MCYGGTTRSQAMRRTIGTVNQTDSPYAYASSCIHIYIYIYIEQSAALVGVCGVPYSIRFDSKSEMKRNESEAKRKAKPSEGKVKRSESKNEAQSEASRSKAID